MSESFEDLHAVETYKSLMQYGATGLRFVLVSNGAAAIAIMTFVGHLVSNGADNVPDLRWPLGIFLLGVFLGGVAIATTYLTQLRLYNEIVNNHEEAHVFWLRTTFSLYIVGILVFAAGSFLAVWRLS